MPKNTLKAVIQDGLPVLADIGEILTTWSANDASSFLEEGAVLLCVAKVDKPDDRGPFRYALGWPRSAGAPSLGWQKYDHAAGES